MKNVYQYEQDGNLHIEYSNGDNSIKVVLSDTKIVIHSLSFLRVEEKGIRNLEISIVSPTAEDNLLDEA